MKPAKRLSVCGLYSVVVKSIWWEIHLRQANRPERRINTKINIDFGCMSFYGESYLGPNEQMALRTNQSDSPWARNMVFVLLVNCSFVPRFLQILMSDESWWLDWQWCFSLLFDVLKLKYLIKHGWHLSVSRFGGAVNARQRPQQWRRQQGRSAFSHGTRPKMSRTEIERRMFKASESLSVGVFFFPLQLLRLFMDFAVRTRLDLMVVYGNKWCLIRTIMDLRMIGQKKCAVHDIPGC